MQAHQTIRLRVGARSSPLSRAQFEEVSHEFFDKNPSLIIEPVWASSPGDRDRGISLRGLERSDLFTRDLDAMLLSGDIDLAIHSAKDLPEPLPFGLQIVVLTKGLDPRDSLVLREGLSLEALPKGAVIATSSERREAMVRKLNPFVRCIDLRGCIEERLAKLSSGEADGVVVAEAALIRLKLTHLHRVILPGDTVPLQGKLAIVGRAEESSAQIQNLHNLRH